MWQGLSNVLPITVGQASLLVAAAMVLFCWFYDRSQIHVGTVVYQLVYSACLDLFAPLLRFSSVPAVNVLLMLLGLVIFSFGSALYSAADFGRGSYEAFTFAFVNKNCWSIQWVRIVLDIFCVVTGWLLGGQVGLCTVATILLSGVLLQGFSTWLNPLVAKLLR